MHKAAMTLLALIALVAIPTASAGTGRWFYSTAQMSQAIEAKYYVSAARCFAPQGSDIVRYNAHSWLYPNGVRRWDTGICGIALPGRPGCTAVAYMTGPWSNDMRLGTHWFHGCTPYQLLRR